MTRTSRPASRAAVRVAAGLALGAVAVLLGATAASAHVRVDGEDATRGGYGVLTFRVPTESATASTTELTVTMPTDTPIASASVQPVPGWTAKVTEAKLTKPITTDDGQISTYVSKITWKADSARTAIAPGEFQQFAVSAGPLPDTAEVAFPAKQTYSDGTVVNWNEASTGSAEPEHPVPVLQLAAAAADGDHHGGAPTASATPASATAAAADPGSASAGLAVGIGGAAIAVVALVVAVIGLLRGSRRA
ncbi:YcnI family protein [uncultured Amnibacterium sp.]|uniref:YcnI family protein n=1 Tax=uncultured Amnibacterium sp. TaxID=1631851 RepID=UPI0035C977B7